MTMKILIATGGTGGHIFPALAVAARLKENGHEVVFAGAFKNTRAWLGEEGYAFYELQAKGLSSESLKSFLDSCSSMIQSILRTFCLLRRIRPDGVLGFGGYGAFPVVLTAAVCRYPTLIHEQNAVPGRANRLLSPLVSGIAVSFERSRDFFPASKTKVTGCPCRATFLGLDREKALKDLELRQDKRTLLVLGGSQGSLRINSVFPQAASLLKEVTDFQVIHVTGQKDNDEFVRQYGALGIPCRVVPYLDDIARAYTACDLAISRAGAVTVTELALFGVPAVLIPYPFAGGHQKQNALVLQERGAAKIIEEQDLTPEVLRDHVLSFFTKGLGSQKVKESVQDIVRPNAAADLAREVVCLNRRM